MSKISINVSEKYIESMSVEQKEFLLRALTKMASIDDHFDECEKKFILDLADDLRLSPVVARQIIDNHADDHLFEDAKKQNDRTFALELIKALCLLAHTDDELSDTETLFIGKLGQTMGVELEKIEQISNWVIDYLIWYQQGKIIFEKV